MEVSSIIYKNFDLLYRVASETDFIGSEKAGFRFGCMYRDVLNNVSVTLQLNSVTMSEYFFMKLHYSNVSRLSEFIYDTEYSKNKYNDEINKAIKGLNTTLKTFSEHTKLDYTDSVLPMGVLTCNVGIILTGNDLLRILSNDMGMLFKAITNNDAIENVDQYGNYKLKQGYYLRDDYHDKLDGFIINKFTNDLYNSILTLVSRSDHGSELFLANTIQRSTKNDRIGLTEILSPYFSLNLIDDAENIVSELSKYKNLNKGMKFTLDNTIMKFTIVAPVRVMLGLLELIPNNSLIFYNVNNLNIGKKIDDYNEIPQCPKGLEVLGQRYLKKLSDVINSIYDKYNNDQKEVLSKIIMSRPFDDVAFELKLSFNDINNYIAPYLEDSDNDGTVSNSQITYFINEIIKMAKAIGSSIL